MKLLKLVSALGLALAAVGSATAAPSIPNGQVYISFNGTEQLSPAGAIVAPSGATEQNWGVGRLATIYQGDGTAPPFFGSAGEVWSPTAGVDEITFIIWGVKPVACGASGAICGTGGFIDLYYDNTPDAGTPPVVTDRGTASVDCAVNCDNGFTGYTNGEFLVRLAFASGIDSTAAGVNIVGTATTVTSGFAGFADSFVNVDTSIVGAWTDLLDTDYFTTAFGTRDMRLRNIYNGPAGATFNTATCGQTPSDICGAQFSDPARAFAIPEPGSLALLGLGMMGLSLMRRRDRS